MADYDKKDGSKNSDYKIFFYKTSEGEKVVMPLSIWLAPRRLSPLGLYKK